MIDPTTWKVVKKIRFQVPGVRPELLQPVGIEFSKDGKLAFTALVRQPRGRHRHCHQGGQGLHPGRPASLALEPGPEGKKLYVANGLTNDMTIIDMETLKPEKSVPVGRLPWGVAIMP